MLIDTNIYSAAFRGDVEVRQLLRQRRRIGISVISAGELLNGFKGGNREAQNRKQFAVFLNSSLVHLYSIDFETAELYASISNDLRQNGTPVPTNDIWRAAIAIQNSLELVTKDKHFGYISGLQLLRM